MSMMMTRNIDIDEEAMNLTMTSSTRMITGTTLLLGSSPMRLREYSWTFIYPIICVIGVCTQSINIAIFVRLKKDRLNKYCLVHSISYFFYTLICTFSFLIRCGSLCNGSTSSTLVAKFYEHFIFDYITSVLAIFSIMIETRLSFERYLLVTNGYLKTSGGKSLKFKWILLILLGLSILFYFPALFTESIYKDPNREGGYLLMKNEFGNSRAGKTVLIAQSALRNLILLLVNSIINILTIIRFRKYIKNKRKMQGSLLKNKPPNLEENGEEKSNQNLTYMIIFMFINYFIGNLPYAFIFILSQLTHLVDDKSMAFAVFRFFANLILFSHIIVISFIYYNFNRAYYQLFNLIILRRQVNGLSNVAASAAVLRRGNTNSSISYKTSSTKKKNNNNNNNNKTNSDRNSV